MQLTDAQRRLYLTHKPYQAGGHGAGRRRPEDDEHERRFRLPAEQLKRDRIRILHGEHRHRPMRTSSATTNRNCTVMSP